MTLLSVIADKLVRAILALMRIPVGRINHDDWIIIKPVTPDYASASQLQRILDEREQARKAAEDIAYFDEE
jgi:hypothetical protein